MMGLRPPANKIRFDEDGTAHTLIELTDEKAFLAGGGRRESGQDICRQ